MTSEVTVECDWPSTFEAYRNRHDELRNAIVIPQSCFDDLDVPPFSYVEAVPESESFVDTDPAVFHAVAFDEMNVDGPPYPAALRTNLMREVGEGREPTRKLRLRPLTRDGGRELPESDLLDVYRAYATDTDSHFKCYLHSTVRDDLRVSEGDFVECYNVETGGRIPLRVASLHDDEDSGKIRMDGHSRRVLQVGLDDQVRVRPCVHAFPARMGLVERLFDPFVGHRQVGLRVVAGRDRDEHRGIVRIDDDMMELLGVSPGDMVTIEWNGQRTSARCLLPEADDHDELSVRMPSTVRDKIGVSIYDTAYLRRDMPYVFSKSVALSTFGILGVVLGGLRVSEFVATNFGLVLDPVFVLLVIGLVSVLVIWLILLPERRKCT